MLKEYDDEGYNRVLNQAFTGFLKDVGFNNGLSAPQPDFVEGLEMQEYRPFRSTIMSAAPFSIRIIPIP